MPTQADLPAAQQHLQARNTLFQSQRNINFEILENATTPCDSYLREFEHSRVWVVEQPEMDDLPEFSRDSIDHYFTRVVAYRKGKPDNTCKVVSAFCSGFAILVLLVLDLR